MSEHAAGKTALVVGASRGLGLGLTRELAQRGWRVTATVRGAGPEGIAGVAFETLDIDDAASVAAFVAALNGAVFDLAVINAGVSGPPAAAFDTASEAEIAGIFTTNAVSPVRLARRLLPMMRPRTGVLAFMSSLMGSVEGATRAPLLYSASKAALNLLSRGLLTGAPEERGVTVVSLHPGWVRTDLGGPNAPLDVHTSAAGMADVLEGQAGVGGHRFLDYAGKTVPW